MEGCCDSDDDSDETQGETDAERSDSLSKLIGVKRYKINRLGLVDSYWAGWKAMENVAEERAEQLRVAREEREYTDKACEHFDKIVQERRGIMQEMIDLADSGEGVVLQEWERELRENYDI